MIGDGWMDGWMDGWIGIVLASRMCLRVSDIRLINCVCVCVVQCAMFSVCQAKLCFCVGMTLAPHSQLIVCVCMCVCVCVCLCVCVCVCV